MSPYDRVCAACGGTVRRFARAGRTGRYKGFELPLPSSLELVECERCGERFVSRTDRGRIEEALAAEYRRHLRAKLEVALRKLDDAGFKLIDVERELGLSAGYLSKVRKRVEPSFQLVALLSLVADEPLRATAKLHGLRRT